jgi:hypothetical protein
MSALYELAGEYKELYAMMTDDPENEAIQGSIEAVLGEIEVKGEGYIAVCDRLDMEISECEKQVKSWQYELKVRKNALKRLKDRLVTFLMMIGKDEMKAGNRIIKLRKNGGVAPLRFSNGLTSDIPIDDIDINCIPKEYRRVEVKEVVDSKKIREALDRGETFDWVKYGERGANVKFK